MNVRKNLTIALIITILTLGFGGLLVANQQLVDESSNPDVMTQVDLAQGEEAAYEYEGEAYEDEEEYEEAYEEEEHEESEAYEEDDHNEDEYEEEDDD